MYKVEPNKSSFDLHNYDYVYDKDKKCHVYWNKIFSYINIKPYSIDQINKINELNKWNFLTNEGYWQYFQWLL